MHKSEYMNNSQDGFGKGTLPNAEWRKAIHISRK